MRKRLVPVREHLRGRVGQAAEADALVQGGVAVRQPLAELALQAARPVCACVQPPVDAQDLALPMLFCLKSCGS